MRESTAIDNSAQYMSYADRAEFYDIEYCNDQNYSFILSLITPEIRVVIEVPCGTGRHAELLASTGCHVFAIDIEPAMIEQVKRRIARSKPAGAVTPVIDDMRALTVSVRADLIIIAPEAFQFILDDEVAEAALRSMSTKVLPNGRIIVDMSAFRASPNPSLNYYSPDAPDGQERFEWTRPIPAGGTLSRWCSQRHYGRDIVEIQLRYFAARPKQNDLSWTACMKFRMYSVAGFIGLVNRAGLFVERVLGDYEGRPFTDGAPRMIFFLTNNA